MDQPARVAVAILMAVSLGACGQPVLNASSGTRYTVTASLMQNPGKPANVCWGMPLPDPPIGCGGPPVADLDLSTMPDAQRYRNGVVGVGTYTVVGTWGGGSLHLTQPLTAAQPNDRSAIKECKQNPMEPSPTDTPQGQRLMADESILQARGIVLLEFYMCRGTMFIGVAVADRDTVDFLDARYAPVEVAGWLRPV